VIVVWKINLSITKNDTLYIEAYIYAIVLCNHMNEVGKKKLFLKKEPGGSWRGRRRCIYVLACYIHIKKTEGMGPAGAGGIRRRGIHDCRKMLTE